MAEIRVEPKSQGGSKAWLWILLLVIVAAAAYWMYATGRIGGRTASVARADTARDSVAPAVGATTTPRDSAR